MAHDEKGVDITLPVAADLSASQYCGIKVDSNGRAALAGEGDIAIGILQNKPDALNRAATVRIAGVSKVLGGGTVSPGARFSFNSTGKAVSVGSGDDHAMGVCLETTDSGKITTVLIQPVGTTL